MNSGNLILSFFILFLVGGCAYNRMEKDVEEFRGTVINIPSDIQEVKHRNISEIHKELKPVKMVIYYDTLECGTCNVKHLGELLDLYDLQERFPSMEVLTIFSPRIQEYDSIMLELMRINFDYPIYVDANGSFSEKNRIPADKRFHSFLLDRNNHPVFIGKPIVNDKLWTIFTGILENMDSNAGVYKEK